MTADDHTANLKALFEQIEDVAPDADIRLSDTLGWIWVNVVRHPPQGRVTYSKHFPLEHTSQDIDALKASIIEWWALHSDDVPPVSGQAP